MSQRDRLLKRRLPTVPFRLMVDDDSDARRELADAEAALELAQYGPQDDAAKAEVKKARGRVEKARAALDACYEVITIRAVTPARFEEMMKDHPPREGKKEEIYNPETFSRALFLEGVQDPELTRDEWEVFLDTQLSKAERDGSDGIFWATLALNTRTPSEDIPKG